MKITYARFALFVLIVGLLTACGSQATNTPTAAPTESVAPATEAPTNPPAATDTSVPATEAPTATELAVQGATVSFATDILPIIQSRCINCHGGDRTEKGLSMKTYADLMAGSENGAVLVPGDAAHSKLVDLVVTQKMPKRGPKLTPPQIEAITNWVNQGALDN